MCPGYVWNVIHFFDLIDYFATLKYMFFKPWVRMLSLRLKNLFNNISRAICYMHLSRLGMHLLLCRINMVCHFTFICYF